MLQQQRGTSRQTLLCRQTIGYLSSAQPHLGIATSGVLSIHCQRDAVLHQKRNNRTCAGGDELADGVMSWLRSSGTPFAAMAAMCAAARAAVAGCRSHPSGSLAATLQQKLLSRFVPCVSRSQQQLCCGSTPGGCVGIQRHVVSSVTQPALARGTRQPRAAAATPL